MIRIRDEAGLFSASDVASLQEMAGKWPFDVHLVTSSASPSKGAFETVVGQAVDGPNVVAIGIDPAKHFTAVHFGKGTDIPASQWSAIISAGNGSFKGAHWVEGVGKIGERAVSAKQQAQTLQPSGPEVDESSNTGWWVFGGVSLVTAFIGLLLWHSGKKRKEERRRMEAAIEAERRRSASAYRNPAPAPRIARPAGSGIAPAAQPSTVVVNNDHSNDLATGYVLGSMSHTPAPAPSPKPASSSSSSSSSHSSGGSSSSWDSGSSYSGGGFDSGGGGFDAGGGGSSW